MQRITVNLPLSLIPESLRTQIQSAGVSIESLPQSISVTTTAANGDEITTIYSGSGDSQLAKPAQSTPATLERDEREEERFAASYMNNLKATLKEESKWLSQEERQIKLEDDCLKSMDIRAVDYFRRRQALKTRRTKYTERSQLQGVRRRQIRSGNARGEFIAQANVPADNKIAKKLHRRSNRRTNSRSSPGSNGPRSTANVQQQPLPAPGLPSVKEVVQPILSSIPDLYSIPAWIPRLPSPNTSTPFEQRGLFNFGKSGTPQDSTNPLYNPNPTDQTIEYVEPSKSFTFPTMSQGTIVLEAGIHPDRLAQMAQDNQIGNDADSQPSAFDLHLGGRQQTGANMEPLAKKRPSSSKLGESPCKKRLSPTKMGNSDSETTASAKFATAPSILHGYPYMVQNFPDKLESQGKQLIAAEPSADTQEQNKEIDCSTSGSGFSPDIIQEQNQPIHSSALSSDIVSHIQEQVYRSTPAFDLTPSHAQEQNQQIYRSAPALDIVPGIIQGQDQEIHSSISVSDVLAIEIQEQELETHCPATAFDLPSSKSQEQDQHMTSPSAIFPSFSKDRTGNGPASEAYQSTLNQNSSKKLLISARTEPSPQLKNSSRELKGVFKPFHLGTSQHGFRSLGDRTNQPKVSSPKREKMAAELDIIDFGSPIAKKKKVAFEDTHEVTSRSHTSQFHIPDSVASENQSFADQFATIEATVEQMCSSRQNANHENETPQSNPASKIIPAGLRKSDAEKGNVSHADASSAGNGGRVVLEDDLHEIDEVRHLPSDYYGHNIT